MNFNLVILCDESFQCRLLKISVEKRIKEISKRVKRVALSKRLLEINHK